jgi:hypothetical protein
MPPTQLLKLNMCECGDLHLTYRSVTLHFEREEFLHFAVQVSRMATGVSRTTKLRQTMAFTNTKVPERFH